ncbi:Protein fam72a, partial [Lobulomyces angularis]
MSLSNPELMNEEAEFYSAPSSPVLHQPQPQELNSSNTQDLNSFITQSSETSNRATSDRVFNQTVAVAAALSRAQQAHNTRLEQVAATLNRVQQLQNSTSALRANLSANLTSASQYLHSNSNSSHSVQQQRRRVIRSLSLQNQANGDASPVEISASTVDSLQRTILAANTARIERIMSRDNDDTTMSERTRSYNARLDNVQRNQRSIAPVLLNLPTPTSTTQTMSTMSPVSPNHSSPLSRNNPNNIASNIIASGRSNGTVNPSIHPQFRSKVVVKIYCDHCSSEICKRGMKAILLGNTKVELYSTDTPPTGVQLVYQDYTTQNCQCRIRDGACLGCGNVVSYHVTHPCVSCLEACNNGHFWMFHAERVTSKERMDDS